LEGQWWVGKVNKADARPPGQGINEQSISKVLKASTKGKSSIHTVAIQK
jgi:hypothetical protein